MKYVDVNKCIFSGRLCEDPEVKDIGDGKKLARFRLAVECYKKEDKKVNFLKFVTWNCANFAEKNLKRGMKVLVESTCNSGSYLNGSGSKVYTRNSMLRSSRFWIGEIHQMNRMRQRIKQIHPTAFLLEMLPIFQKNLNDIRIDQIIQVLMITILRRIHPLRLMISHPGNARKSCRKENSPLRVFFFVQKNLFLKFSITL